MQLIAFAGVAGAALALYGLWRLFRAGELRDYRFVGVAFAMLFVVFRHPLAVRITSPGCMRRWSRQVRSGCSAATKPVRVGCRRWYGPATR